MYTKLRVFNSESIKKTDTNFLKTLKQIRINNEKLSQEK